MKVLKTANISLNYALVSVYDKTDIIDLVKSLVNNNFQIISTGGTAKVLKKAKIKVIITPDLAAEESIKKCDIFLFGADAFTKNIVANKIGTSTLNRLAKIHNIPTYSCGVSKKFTKKIKIEKRPTWEVWDRHHNKIEILNPAFDKTKMKDISGIISEFGILTPKQFVKKIKNSKQPS